MEWTRPRPPHQLACSLQAQQWYDYEHDDEKRLETTPTADRDDTIRSFLPSRSSSSAHTNVSSTPSHEGMALQSLSLLNMPPFEEATEFQPFCVPSNNSFLDYASLPALPPQQLSQEQHPRSLQQFEDQLPPQFGLQFSDLSSERSNYYIRSLPLSSTPLPSSQSVMRPGVDYLQDGMSSTFGLVPSLPTTFGTFEQQQQQRLLPGQNEEFDENVAQNMTSTMFQASFMASTEPSTSPELSSSFSLQSHSSTSLPARQSVNVETKPPDYSPVVVPKRENGLREPFRTLAITDEPKFSPDKRKLCCVEGCVSQARAFNRCKRHGGSKRCSSPGCTKSIQSRGLCIRHGGGSRCQEKGCTRASQSQGRCKLHGGGRPCIVKGCEKKAHLKRLCRKHGGGTKCCVPNCDKWSQRQGMCMTHSKVAGLPSNGESAQYDLKATTSLSLSASPLSLPTFTDAV